jgi:hypothetical protein
MVASLVNDKVAGQSPDDSADLKNACAFLTCGTALMGFSGRIWDVLDMRSVEVAWGLSGSRCSANA